MRSIEHSLAQLGKFAATVPHAHPVSSGERLVAMDRLPGRPEGLAGSALERFLGQLLTRFRTGFGPGGSQRMFGDLFALVIARKFAARVQIGAAFRALAVVERTLLVINRSLDLVGAARVEGARNMNEKVKLGSVKSEFEQRMMSLLPLVNRLPRRLNKISDDLGQDRFSMNVRVLGHVSDRSFLAGLFGQRIVAILARSAVLGAILLITSNEGPLLTGEIHLYGLLGFALLFGSSVLGMRALMLVFRSVAED